MIYPPVHAVFFDVGGTLLHPVSVARNYSRTGQKYGSKLSEDGMRERFLAAFRRQEEHDRTLDWRTDDERELQRWQAIVREVLHDVVDFEPCFAELYAIYASPAGWILDADAPQLLETLAAHGIQLGVASNYDRRLFNLVGAIPELKPLRHVIVSSQVGHRKPSLRFFDAMIAASQTKRENTLLVGDDFDNDYRGALDAGLQAVLLDPRVKHLDRDVRRIERLGELANGIGLE